MSRDTSGPAFPFPGASEPIIENGHLAMKVITAHGGMTLRQWYAGMAMQGIIATHCGQPTPADALVAKWAFEMADAMLAHEAKEEK